MKQVLRTKVEQLEFQMLELIVKNELGDGEKIASENQLMQKFSVCRSTIRKSLGNLVSLGVLSRTRGSGTFVNSIDLARDHWKQYSSESAPANVAENKFYNICFLLSMRSDETLENSFHFMTFLGANREAMRLNCRLEVLDFDENSSCEEVEAQLLRREIDGFIVPRSDVIPNAIIEKMNLPSVYCGGSFFFQNHDYIQADDAQGGRQATEYLMRLGHKRIAFVDHYHFNARFKNRMHGYAMTYEYNKVPLDREMIFTYRGPDSINDLILKKKPTAIFAANDAIAIEIAESLKKLNIKVPEDISIMGFDNRPSVIMKMPELTTMKIPQEILGKLAMQTIFNRFQNLDCPPFKQLVKTELVERNSCAKID